MKLTFFYGTMESSKTAHLLMIEHNYNQKGVQTVVMKPVIDNRDGDKITSRIGLSKKADYLIDDQLTNHALNTFEYSLKNGYVILIDEAQFLDYDFIKKLSIMLRNYPNGEILCFGLLTDMNGQLFEGSKALIEESDKITEIKTLCHYCNHKAVKNKFLGDETVNGNIAIGTNYVPVCNYHYYHGVR